MEMERFETFHLSETLATITEPSRKFTSRLIEMIKQEKIIILITVKNPDDPER